MLSNTLDIKIKSVASRSFVDDNPYNRLFVFGIVLNATLGSLFFGFNMGIFNNAGPFIKKCLITSDALFFLVSSFVPLGAGIGSIFGSSLAKNFGRRKSMLITDLLATIGVILELCVAQPDPGETANSTALIIGRLICGICVGLNSCVVPLYISEISPIKIRGITGSFHQILVTIGILTSYLLATVFFPAPNPDNTYNCQFTDYKYALGFPLLTTFVRSFLLLGVFRGETPKFSLWNDELEDAIRMLQKVYVGNYYSDKYAFLKREKDVERFNPKINFKELFSPKYRFRFFTGCALATLQQLSGINAIIFYSTFLFLEKSTFVTETWITIIIGTIGLVSAIVNGWLSTLIGRRPILLIGTSIISALMCLYASIGNSGFLVVIIFIFAFVFGLSLGPVMWLYLAEILPDVGLGVAVFVDWVFTFLVTVGFHQLQAWFGDQHAFFVFSISTFFGSIMIYFCVKETKGKTDLEIANSFYGGSTVSDDRSLILGGSNASLKSSFGEET